MWRHVTWLRLTSIDFDWLRWKSIEVTSLRLTSIDLTWLRLTWLDFDWLDLTSIDLTWLDFDWLRLIALAVILHCANYDYWNKIAPLANKFSSKWRYGHTVSLSFSKIKSIWAFRSNHPPNMTWFSQFCTSLSPYWASSLYMVLGPDCSIGSFLEDLSVYMQISWKFFFHGITC